MISGFEIVKWIHILMAIVAVGFNASYGIWLARAGREPDHELHVLRGVKVLDDRFANPAYGLLLVTGIWMVAISPFEITEFWILAALVLYAVAVGLGAAAYTPTLRKQIAVLESEGPASPTFRRLAARGRVVGIVLAVDVVAIVFLMVAKPTL
ncbi:MAG: DUF2269 family protein [Actinomycetota bacterium]